MRISPVNHVAINWMPLRNGVALVVMTLGMLMFMAAPSPAAAPAGPGEAPASLSMEDRVQGMRAVEEVYWSHREWPAGNAGAKPSLETVLPPSVIEGRAHDALRLSTALRQIWERPITSEMLQAEMDRMAIETRDPDMLGELWAALGNDPALVAECLARPLLADRLVRSAYAFDKRFHGAVREQAEQELAAVASPAGLKGLSGRYREAVWVRRDASPGRSQGDRRANVLNAEEWSALEERLAAAFGLGAGMTLPVGVVSPLREDETRFYVLAVLAGDGASITVASAVWDKRPFDQWWREAKGNFKAEADAGTEGASYSLSGLRSYTCSDNQWSNFPSPPSGRWGHIARWISPYLVVWGGQDAVGMLNTGGRYNPTTDTWAPTAQSGAPSARTRHAAATEGTTLMVWGGYDGSGYLNTGGIYNPGTDVWVATDATGAPTARGDHAMTYVNITGLGSQWFMLWGGENAGGYVADWKVYVPSNQPGSRWVDLAPTGSAPAGRKQHTLTTVTGFGAVVWGGLNAGGALNSGAYLHYDSGFKWVTVNTSDPDAPAARYNHTAVYSGTKVIIWGGRDGSGVLNTGGQWVPSILGGSWDPVTATGTPAGRQGHTAVWASSRMVVWGGMDLGGATYTGTGGRYTPAAGGGSWEPVTTTGAPTARAYHAAVSNGTTMIVWGGRETGLSGPLVTTGGRYNPSTDGWTATGSGGTPSARYFHATLWTGTEIIVWGGQDETTELDTGARYTPGTSAWDVVTTTGAPDPRSEHSLVWSGTEAIAWGGRTGDYGSCYLSGGRYTPGGGWTATDESAAPAERFDHRAVWAASRMVVWGGTETDTWDLLETGGIYNPSADSWAGTSLTGVPAGREFHTAVSTGTTMIVYGGMALPDFETTDTGGIFDPSVGASGQWAAMTPSTGVLDPRWDHTAVWTGDRMIVWGGSDNDLVPFGNGAAYDPVADDWTAVSGSNAPGARSTHAAAWSGRDMFVWGGLGSSALLDTGGRFTDASDAWLPMSTAGAPRPRQYVNGVWAGNYAAFWGGYASGVVDTGGLYCACTSAPGQATNPSPANDPETPICVAPALLTWNGEGIPGTYDVILNNTLTCDDTVAPSCASGVLEPAVEPYEWRVDTLNSCVAQPVQGTTWKFYLQPNPGAPASPVPADGGTACHADPFTVAWTPGSNSEEYDVSLDGSNPPTTGRCLDIADASCDVSGLATGTTYFWQVTARNTCSDVRGQSTHGPVWSYYHLGTPAAPTSVTDNEGGGKPAQCTTSGVTVTWEALTGAQSYNLFVDGSSVQTGLAGPSALYEPGDNISHNFAIQAVRNGTACPVTPVNTTAGTDEDFTPDATITAASAVCAGYTGNTASVPDAGDGADYDWDITNGVITEGDGTREITFTAGSVSPVGLSVTVTESHGCSNSGNLNITVNDPPVITVQPASTTLCSESGTTLSVTATGTGLTYQWYRGLSGNTEDPISGATSSSYATGNLTGTMDYWVRVSGTAPCLAADSDTATVTINDPPVITVQPASTTLCSGSGTTLSVTATGTGLTYQWYRGTKPDTSIPLGTASTQATGDLTATTSYWVRVYGSDPCPDVDSNTATVTVNDLPVITVQPASTTLCSGSGTTLSVTATGTGLTYQWYQGTHPDASIPLGTASTQVTGNLTATTSYWVRVYGSDPCPDADSNTATVTVNDPPVITVQPASTTLCSGSGTTLLVTATGTGLTYQWYQGTHPNTSIPLGTATTQATGNLTATTSYWVRVYGSDPCPDADSSTATVTINDPPVITVQPASTTLCSGSGTTLSVTATGTGLTYQWYRGLSGNTGDPISGAISSSYATGTLSATTSYWVRVYGTDPCPDVDSSTATVTVNPLPEVTFTPDPLSPVCVTVPPFALSGGSPTGGVYSGPGVSDGNFDPAAAGAGTHTLIYTYTDVNECTNSDQSHITVDAAPSLPVITNIADNNACAYGITITFTAGSPATRHDLYVDTVLAKEGVTSPHVHTPSDALSHTYVVRAVNGTCSADSAPYAFSDLNDFTGSPVLDSITDLSACQTSGIQITYTKAGNPSAKHYLYKDSVEVPGELGDSPVTYLPGDNAPHTYFIQARKGSCSGNSNSLSATDVNNTPSPVITEILLTECPSKTVRLSTASGKSDYQWDRWIGDAWVPIDGATTYYYDIVTPCAYTYRVTYRDNGCLGSSTGHAASTLCDGPSAMGDGLAPASGGAGGDLAAFSKSGVWDEVTQTIAVTYDITRCPSVRAAILTGNLTGLNNFDGYDTCALSNGGNGGSTSFNSAGQSNVWYSILWVDAAGVAGHPGFGRSAGAVEERTWQTGGLCGTTDLGSYLTCP